MHDGCAIAPDWPETFFASGYLECFEQMGKFDTTDTDVRSIVRLLGLRGSARILDVPCGFGRHAGLLAQAGFVVVGVDSSADQLSLAHRLNPGPKYVRSDMREPPDGPFDAVINLWTSFGYYPTAAEDIDAINAWYKVLADGGYLLMELSDLERAQHGNRVGDELVSRSCRWHGDVYEEAWFDWTEQMAYVHLTRNGTTRQCRTRIYSRDALCGIIDEAGFDCIECFGDFCGNPKRPSNRLVIRARKP